VFLIGIHLYLLNHVYSSIIEDVANH